VTFIAWQTKVVVQYTGSGGSVEESPVGHKVVGASAMVRSLCELDWEKGERRGRGSLGKEACERRAYKRAGKRGAYRGGGRGECGTMPRPREHDTRGPRH
jgi:hypothetical protein